MRIKTQSGAGSSSIFSMAFWASSFRSWASSIIMVRLTALSPGVLSFKSLQFGETRFWTSSDINLGQIIENETPSDKPIYLLGLNSSFYVFSGRFPNKPWLDNFGWYLEIPGVQEKVIAGFTKDPPSTIFWVTSENGSWYDIGTYQPKMITDWILRNYNQKVQVGKGVWQWTRK